MKAVSGKQFSKLLESRGWQLKQVEAYQRQPPYLVKQAVPVRISVPVHGDTTLKGGLQRHWMKLAGIEESDL